MIHNLDPYSSSWKFSIFLFYYHLRWSISIVLSYPLCLIHNRSINKYLFEIAIKVAGMKIQFLLWTGTTYPNHIIIIFLKGEVSIVLHFSFLLHSNMTINISWKETSANKVATMKLMDDLHCKRSNHLPPQINTKLPVKINRTQRKMLISPLRIHYSFTAVCSKTPLGLKWHQTLSPPLLNMPV